MTRSRSFRRVCLVLLLMNFSSGCGADNPLDRKAISGKVTLDGAPLQHGSISFEPQQRDGVSSGAVISEGSYEIEAVRGLPEGEYLVRIHSARGGDAPAADGPPGPAAAPPAVELISAEYNTQSNQRVKVTAEGPNAFSFEIRGK